MSEQPTMPPYLLVTEVAPYLRMEYDTARRFLVGTRVARMRGGRLRVIVASVRTELPELYDILYEHFARPLSPGKMGNGSGF